MRKKAKVITNCVADHYSSDAQKIVEFVFPNGEGGLIEFGTTPDGHNMLHVYRTHVNILITVGTETAYGQSIETKQVNTPGWFKGYGG